MFWMTYDTYFLFSNVHTKLPYLTTLFDSKHLMMRNNQQDLLDSYFIDINSLQRLKAIAQELW